MTTIAAFQVLAVDLPFRTPFKHAAAERESSSSVFLRCETESGTVGYGESLPRDYVTGESRDGVVDMLSRRILPQLVGREFESLKQVEAFLRQCDGKAPAEWVDPGEPQTAAWCAVDIALLDTLGREFGETVWPDLQVPAGFRHSGVLTSRVGWAGFKSALKMRLFGIRQLKVKVERDTPRGAMALLRRVIASGCELRVDANMAWTPDEAIERIAYGARYGIRMVEQPVAADDLDGMARVLRETDCSVMADESFSDRASLERLIEHKACNAVNVRISKCGGLVAAFARCRQALEAGLVLQVGCQVGESSLMSAAHLALVAAAQQVTYAEGCYGLNLLRQDPASPVLQLGYGGRPPARPTGPGFGVRIDEAMLRRHTVRTEVVR